MIKPEPLPLTLTPRVDIPFIFESYRELVRDLGAMDGLAAAQTLASQHFINDAKKLDDPQQFVRSLAVHYKVSTRFVDFPRLPAHLTQLLIVGTCQQAEAFLDKFRREQITMGRIWRDRADNEPRLKYTLASLPGDFALNCAKIYKERYELHEYYRIVRNSFVHSSIERSRVRRHFNDVKILRGMVKDAFGLHAPNPVEHLTFADHILFTRITKYIATDLCRLAPPATGHEMWRILLLCPDQPAHPLTRILGRKSSPETLRHALRRWFRERYNFNLRDRPAAENELVERVGNLPNKRQRRLLGEASIVDYARKIELG